MSGYWLCVGDCGEVEARIGPNPLEWFPTHGEALAECVRLNRYWMEKAPDWEGGYTVKSNLEVYERATKVYGCP